MYMVRADIIINRFDEIVNEVRGVCPNDKFFHSYETNLSNKLAKSYYEAYNTAFSCLDDISWQRLKQKALKHFTQHREGQLKQAFYDQLNDAFAYQFLKNCGYSEILVLEENGSITTDLSYKQVNTLCYCEVKTIGISDLEIERRELGHFSYAGYSMLSEGFFNKLIADITTAQEQILSMRSQGIIFIVANFDDFTGTHTKTYHTQLTEFIDNCEHKVNIKIGILDNLHVSNL